MALTIGDNFKYQANKPNFERDSFATLGAMKAYPETSIDDGHLSYCVETNKHYKFLSSNTVDETTGKWREFETTVGNSFPSDGVEGQYLKKSDTGVKWDDGDVFYLNSMDFDSGSVTQDTYNKLVNAITNNKIIYIVSNFDGENQAFSPIASYYEESRGIIFEILIDGVISTVHINPDLTVEQEVKESIPVATTNTNGLMSAEDKTKLDSVSNNANNYTHPAGSAASKSLGLYKISTDSTSHVKSVSAVTKSDITSLGIPAQDTTYNNATSTTSGLMSAADKEKLDSLNVDGGSTVVTDARALKGATMRFSGFVNGVNITQTGVNEWDGIVYDTSINKFLAKKGTLTPTYHNIWTGMDAYMSDEVGTSILKDKLYLYGEDIYKWSDSEGTLVKVISEGSSTTPDVPLATQSTDGLMSSEDKTKLDNIDVDGITEAINDKRALNGATMRFSSFVNGVTVEQVGTIECDSIVFDTAINRFLAKKNNSMLSPTYYNIWQGMDAYMSDESGTSILKDKLYICDDVVYSWSDAENTLVKVDKEISNATQSKAGLMSAEDKAKLDNLDTSGGVSDPRALNGATMRFNGFVSGVTTAQVGASEWDSIVYDTSINKFLAKKGTLSPIYYNIWSGMDAYMTDGAGTDILKDRLYLYGEDIYAWSDTEGTLIKVTPDIPNATQSEAGLMSAEDKTKLDNVISRIVLSEFSEKKFFGEFSKVTGASAIGWAGALFIDDFSSSEYRDFYCCMTYGQGIVIRHTYKTGVYEYLNSFIVDSSTTSSSYNITNKMNSGGWGKYYNNSELPLAYISRCSPNASYIHTYYAYKINRSVTPFKFERVLTIKYGGSKLAAITSDITIDTEKKHLYVHGYKSGSSDAITGTSIVMVFNLPEPGSSDTITLNDSDILWEFEFFVNEAAQDLCVSGGKLYYPYGSNSLHGLAIIDTKTGKIIQNLDLSTLSTNFIDNPEPEGVALSNGNVYLNYHHSGTNSNEVCLVEFPLQEVKEAIKVPTKVSQLENDANYLTANKDILESVYMYGIEFDTTIADPTCIRIGNPELHRTLPIQSKMRGCLLDDDGGVVKYLNPDTWVDEVLDGSMGQVMVEIPEFYIKFEEDGTKRKVKMSLVPIAGYLKVSKAYISAYEATVQRSTSKLSSVCNEDADYRGGNNDSSYDGTYRTMLGMPATNISLNNFRTYARNRGSVEWNCNLYRLHKMMWWLFAVEYANFNSQSTFKAVLDNNGYHQGGLGNGVTIFGSSWVTFNSTFPVVPCGVTNSLGNHTGTVDYNVIGSDGSTITTFAVPRYRGIENPFGHISKWTDGCKCLMQSEAAGGLSKFYVCNNPANFMESGLDNYEYRGNLIRRDSYTKVIIFGEYGEIMSLEGGGGDKSYFCDYTSTSIPVSGESERAVALGGTASTGGYAGFLCVSTDYTSTKVSSSFGTRLCFIPNYN